MRCKQRASLLLFAFVSAGSSLAQSVYLMSTSVLEGKAIVHPLPPSPPESQRDHHEGVAVAEIVVGSDGAVAQVRLLQAPDAAISAAVSATLLKWRFQPMTSEGKPVSVSSRMIFYFKRAADSYTVIDAGAEEAQRQAARQ